MSSTNLLETIRKPVRPNHYVFPGIGLAYKWSAYEIVFEVKKLSNGKELSIEDSVSSILFRVFGKTHDDLTIETRKSEITFPRQVGMVLLNMLGFSLSASGYQYGRDHATALHAKRKRCFPLLQIKDNKDEYDNLVCAINAAHILYPKINLSELPGGWNDPNARIYKPQPRNGEQSCKVPAMQG